MESGEDFSDSITSFFGKKPVKMVKVRPTAATMGCGWGGDPEGAADIGEYGGGIATRRQGTPLLWCRLKRHHGPVRPSGYESLYRRDGQAALPDCAAYRNQRCHSSAVYTAMLVAVVVSVVLLRPSRLVKVSFSSLSVAACCLAGGWWDAGVSVAWTFVASERPPSQEQSMFHRQSECIFSPF